MPGAGEDEAQLRPFAADRGERLEQPLVVLVLPRVRGVEQERLARAAVRAEPLVVDGEVDCTDARGVEVEALDQRLAGVLAQGDDHPAPAHRPAVDTPAVGQLGAREELGEDLVLDVEHARHRRRRVHRRQHHAEREVDRVELSRAQCAAEPAGRGRRKRHRRHPPGHRPRCPVLVDDRSRQLTAGVLRDRRHERVVLEPPDASERLAQLPRVGFRAPDDAGNERQHRDSDHPAKSSSTGPRRRGLTEP